MSLHSENTWSVLQQAGLVEGDAPELSTSDSPWYVKSLLAFSGWLAAFFLLGFLAFAFQFVFKNTAVSVVVGAIMIGSAFALLRVRQNEFKEQVALAVSLAGQALIIWAIFRNMDDEAGWFLLTLFQVVLAALMPNFIHRVFSSFFAAFCFSVTLALYGVHFIASSVVMLLAAWLWLNEFNYPEYMRKQRAIAYGLALALVQIKGASLFGFLHLGWYTQKANVNAWVQPWMGEVIAGAVMLYVVWQIIKRQGHGFADPISIVSLVGVIILTVVSMEAPGITVGMLIILLGFAGSNRVLMGLGIISLLFYISSYYYMLNTTLLVKSQTLLLVGLVLLAGRWLLPRMSLAAKGAGHD